MVLLSSPALAAVINVPGSDGLSLQGAVESANTGDRLVIDAGYDASTEDPVFIDRAITIEANGAVLPPLGVEGVEVTLTDVTLASAGSAFVGSSGETNCPYDGCALIVRNGSLVLNGLNIEGIQQTGGLVALESQVQGTLRVDSCTGSYPLLLSNTSTAGSHQLDLTYVDNAAPARVASQQGLGTTLDLAGLFERNAGHLVLDDVEAQVHDSTFSLCESDSSPCMELKGGAVAFESCNASGGVASTGGVARILDDARVSWTGGRIDGFEATKGAGFFVQAGGLTLAGVEAANLTATEGGLVYLSPNTEFTLTDSVVENANASGALMYLNSAKDVLIRQSRVCVPTGFGTLMVGNGAQVVVRNTVVQDSRGQLAQADGGSLTLENVTFVGDGGSTGLAGSFDVLDIVNTIFVDWGKAIQVPETAGSRSYNLFHANTENGTLALGQGAVLADPLFEDFFVKDDCQTMPNLSALSPAIDAGHPDLLDSDGGPSDIGAFGGPEGQQPLNADGDTGSPDSGSPDSGGPDIEDSAETGSWTLVGSSGGCGHTPAGGLLLALALVGRRRCC